MFALDCVSLAFIGQLPMFTRSLIVWVFVKKQRFRQFALIGGLIGEVGGLSGQWMAMVGFG